MAAKIRAKKKATLRRAKPKIKPKIKRRAARPAPLQRSSIPPALDRRLRALATKMDKTFDAILLLALGEFADAWEDHFRTVTALAHDDRVQLSVKPEP